MLVVVDRESTDGSHVQALQAREGGIADADLVGRGNTIGSEPDALQRGQGNPFDLVDLLKGSEVNGGELLELLQLELASNLLDRRAPERVDAGLLDNDVSLDLLGAANVDVSRDIAVLIEGDVSRYSRAVNICVAGTLDSDRLAVVLGYIDGRVSGREDRREGSWEEEYEPVTTFAPKAARARRILREAIVI